MAKSSSSDNAQTETHKVPGFTSNQEQATKKAEPVAQPTGSKSYCPDCEGRGIRNLQDTRVCATCEGRGTLA